MRKDRFREVNRPIRLPLVLKLSAKGLFPPHVWQEQPRIDLSSNEKTKTIMPGNLELCQNHTYELGFGFDFYLLLNSPSIRGIFMINDQLIQDTPPTMLQDFGAVHGRDSSNKCKREPCAYLYLE